MNARRLHVDDFLQDPTAFDASEALRALLTLDQTATSSTSDGVLGCLNGTKANFNAELEDVVFDHYPAFVRTAQHVEKISGELLSVREGLQGLKGIVCDAVGGDASEVVTVPLAPLRRRPPTRNTASDAFERALFSQNYPEAKKAADTLSSLSERPDEAQSVLKTCYDRIAADAVQDIRRAPFHRNMEDALRCLCDIGHVADALQLYLDCQSQWVKSELHNTRTTPTALTFVRSTLSVASLCIKHTISQYKGLFKGVTGGGGATVLTTWATTQQALAMMHISRRLKTVASLDEFLQCLAAVADKTRSFELIGLNLSSHALEELHYTHELSALLSAQMQKHESDLLTALAEETWAPVNATLLPQPLSATSARTSAKTEMCVLVSSSFKTLLDIIVSFGTVLKKAPVEVLRFVDFVGGGAFDDDAKISGGGGGGGGGGIVTRIERHLVWLLTTYASHTLNEFLCHHSDVDTNNVDSVLALQGQRLVAAASLQHLTDHVGAVACNQLFCDVFNMKSLPPTLSKTLGDGGTLKMMVMSQQSSSTVLEDLVVDSFLRSALKHVTAVRVEHKERRLVRKQKPEQQQPPPPPVGDKRAGDESSTDTDDDDDKSLPSSVNSLDETTRPAGDDAVEEKQEEVEEEVTVFKMEPQEVARSPIDVLDAIFTRWHEFSAVLWSRFTAEQTDMPTQIRRRIIDGVATQCIFNASLWETTMMSSGDSCSGWEDAVLRAYIFKVVFEEVLSRGIMREPWRNWQHSIREAVLKHQNVKLPPEAVLERRAGSRLDDRVASSGTMRTYNDIKSMILTAKQTSTSMTKGSK
eukprot:PhM_4_TR4074/c0_g3_i1/m.94773